MPNDIDSRTEQRLLPLLERLEDAQSWADVSAFIAALPSKKAKGDAFEHFCAGYYLALGGFSAAYHSWGLPPAIQEQFPRDYGIDLILIRTNGELVPVQCKFRSDSSSRLSWKVSGLTSFFAETRTFDRIILFSNAAGIDRHSSASYGDKLSVVISQDLERLSKPSLASIAKALRSSLPVRSVQIGGKSPRPFQDAVITKVVAKFSSGISRGKMILPCGSGKTLVSLWISERLGKLETILVLVPSLQLLKQTLDEWRESSAAPFSYLCVCSERDIDEDSRTDQTNLSASEIDSAGNVTTSPKKIERFLEGELREHPRRIIFSTYQSLFRVSQAIKQSKHLGAFSFDFALCDEAHKTAGVTRNQTNLWRHISSSFSLIHDDSAIPAKRRLYMTATPRILSERSKSRMSETKLDTVADMTNEKLFGTQFAAMTFAEVIAEGFLTDYEIIGVGVSDAELSRVLSTNPEDDTWSLACAIAFVKVASNPKHPISHAISFHGTVKKAKKLTSTLQSIIGSKRITTSGRFSVSHINGSMSASMRSRKLKSFAKEEGTNLITNARCLTEGVDVPAIDAVFFCDPKRSIVDIVQAVGRAVRPSVGKGKGYIVVPIFHGKKGISEKTLEDNPFGPLVKIIRAMAAVDERLEEEIRIISNKLRRSKGRNHPSIRISDLSHISLEGIEGKLAARIFEEVIQRSVNSAAEKKAQLLAMAESGQARPNGKSSDPSERKLGVSLGTYTSESQSAFDPDFSQKIRTVSPSWFIDSASENKSILLNMAAKDEKRPSSNSSNIGLRRLGSALLTYTSKGNKSFDASFETKIRQVAPAWFEDTVAAKKLALMQLAMANQPKPSVYAPDAAARSLAVAFYRYTSPTAPYFDSKFTLKLKKTAPSWFQDTAAESKMTLLRMAKRGETKPSRNPQNHELEKLGHDLARYTNRSSQSYDKQFTEAIRDLVPYWLMPRSAERKNELLSLATAGSPKPSKTSKDARERGLATALSNYLNKSRVGYDIKFDIAISKIAPQWFVNTAEEKKKKLLQRARNGEDRPLRGTRDLETKRLAEALANYTRESCNVFDKKFTAEIQKVAPHWFRKKRGRK